MLHLSLPRCKAVDLECLRGYNASSLNRSPELQYYYTLLTEPDNAVRVLMSPTKTPHAILYVPDHADAEPEFCV